MSYLDQALLIPGIGGGGGETFADKVLSYIGDSFVFYYPVDELSGALIEDVSPQGNDASLSGGTLGGVDLSGSLGGKGLLLDADGRIDFYSAGVAADFDGDLGSWIGFMTVEDWEDGKQQRVLYMAADASNKLEAYKNPYGS